MTLSGDAFRRFPVTIMGVRLATLSGAPYRDSFDKRHDAFRRRFPVYHALPTGTPQAHHGRLTAAAPWLSRFLSEVNWQTVAPPRILDTPTPPVVPNEPFTGSTPARSAAPHRIPNQTVSLTAQGLSASVARGLRK